MLTRLSLRLGQAVSVVLLVAILAFLLMHLLPGDPAAFIAGPEAGPEAVERLRRQLGLDRSIPEQLVLWLTHLARGDFGRSLVLNEGVLSVLMERLPVTLSLTLVSMVMTLPAGIVLGVLAAKFRSSWADTLVMLLALIGVSVPGFWISILSVILFSVMLHWLPSSGYVPLAQGFWPWFLCLLQPAAMLALFQIGFLARMARSATLDVLNQDYIRTARAKGVTEWRTVTRHAFYNTLIPVITVTGIILSLSIGGSVVIEQVFALPGVGRMIVQAILTRDYPLVQGSMLFLGFAFVGVNLAVDVIYTWVDPRVRHG